MEIQAASYTMSGQVAAADTRVKSLKTSSAEVLLAFEKLSDESSKTNAELWAEMSIAGESLQEEKNAC